MTSRPDGTRLCLATSYTTDFADIGSYCAISLHLYAARWGCGVHVATDIALDRPPAWHRVRLIPELLERGYDFVLWLDADALFLRFDVDILAEVRPGKDLYLVAHDHPAFPSSLVPNTGVMLVRNTAWSRALFDRIWNMTQYETHKWWENAAMIHLLGYHNLLGEGPYAPDETLLARVRFLDQAWNRIPSISTPGTTIIRHYAGDTNDIRRRDMPRDAAAACRATLGDAERPPGAVDLQQRIAALNQQLEALYASRSWRATAPLRHLVDKLRAT